MINEDIQKIYHNDLVTNTISNKNGIIPYAEKRNSDEKGLILNEWEKSPALSNSRLTHQFLGIGFNLHWSIDRLTIVGEMNSFPIPEHTFYTEDGEIVYRAGQNFTIVQLMMLFSMNGAAKKAGNGWQLVTKYGEDVAYVEPVLFKDKDTDKEKARIDFNPNKIQQFFRLDLRDFIKLVFNKPHYSRVDVACDIFNLPNDYVSQYRVVDPVTFRPFYGITGQLETAYWGARSSGRQIRLYNKKLEQEKTKHIVPDEIGTWWRLEMQLRSSKAENWKENVDKSLNSFCAPHYFPLNVSARDKATLIGLFGNHELWDGLSKNTKTKYRKLAKEIAKEDELTQHLKSTFSQSCEDLKSELEKWIVGLF